MADDEVMDQLETEETAQEPGVLMRQYCQRSGRRLEDVPERWVPEDEIGAALAQGWRDVGGKKDA